LLLGIKLLLSDFWASAAPPPARYATLVGEVAIVTYAAFRKFVWLGDKVSNRMHLSCSRRYG
jgi:hypothetical protein